MVLSSDVDDEFAPGAGLTIASLARARRPYGTPVLLDPGVVRIGRPGADGILARGVDCPPEPEWAVHIREHLELYTRLSGRGSGKTLRTLLWIGLALSALTS